MKSSRHTILFGLRLCATHPKNYGKDHAETHQTCGPPAQPIFNITYFSSVDPIFLYENFAYPFWLQYVFQPFQWKKSSL